MKSIQENGVLKTSVRYLFTPSSFAGKYLFYPTRVGHYFCDRAYHFSSRGEIAMQPSHRFHYMLFLIKRGSLSLSLDGIDYKAGPGDIVLFDCKLPHEYFALTDNLEFCWLVFDGVAVSSYFDWLMELYGERHVITGMHGSELQALFDRILLFGKSSGHISEITVSQTIYAILCQLLSATGSEHPQRAGAIEKAMEYMDQHFDAPLLVKDIATVVGLSSSHFTLLFRRELGYAPHEYLSLRRVNHAKELLLSTTKSIREVAFSSGFASEENFIRAFKKATGSSPTAFRTYNF